MRVDEAPTGTQPAGMMSTLPPPPKTVKEARTQEDWPQCEAALKLEQDSLIWNKMWRRKAAPRGTRPITTKVLFDNTLKQAGELDGYKYRLVSMGCRQRPGRDYHDAWAPVPTAASIWALLRTAAAKGWHVHHVDVRTAYLNAPMDVDV